MPSAKRSYSHTSVSESNGSNTPADAGPDHPGGIFCDVNAMKQKIREAALQEEYDVANFYYQQGVWQYIARHSVFEKMTLAVIAFNALWISIDTECNGADVLLEAEEVFQIVEHGFCVYFSFEWYVRFKSFKVKRNGCKDAWFVFDSSLVFMMVMETWVMTMAMVLAGGGPTGGLGNASILRMARLLRLSRMARMARLFRAMPELLILIKGMVAAMRSVVFTLCLLGVIIYVFGIAFRQLVGDSAKDDDGNAFFATVPMAMHTLLIDGALMDGTGNVVKALKKESTVYVAIFYMFVLVASLTVMNMLIGVLCEVVSAVAATEKEQLTVGFVKSQLKQVMTQSGLDDDNDGKISKAEFGTLLNCPKACRALEEVGVDVINLVDNIDWIFPEEEDCGESNKALDFGDFMEVVLKLRGDNTATVKDIVELRKFVKETGEKLKHEITFNAKRPIERFTINDDVTMDDDRFVMKGKSAEAKHSDCELPTSVPSPESGNDTDDEPNSLPNQISHHCHRARDDPAPATDENDLSVRRANLVDALLTAQLEIGKFMEALPAGDCILDETAGLLPGLPLTILPKMVGLNATTPAVKPEFVCFGPFKVQWLPGELAQIRKQLGVLHTSLSTGLHGLQRVRVKCTNNLHAPTKPKELPLLE